MRVLFSFYVTIFFLLSFFGSLNLKALEAKHLKKINFFEEGSPLNPTIGFLWLQGTLENFLELPHENKNLKELIALFFCRDEKGSLVLCKEGFSKLFTPWEIGELLGLLSLDSLMETQLNGYLLKLAANQKEDSSFFTPNKLVNLVGRLYVNRKDPCVYAVFLALLWVKSSSKKDILSYYKGFLRRADSSLLTHYGREILSSLEDESFIWLEEVFTLKTLSESKPSYEEKVYKAYLQKFDHLKLDDSQYKFGKEKKRPFYFGEVFIKNFFQLVLLNPFQVVPSGSSRSYDTRILEELGADPLLIQFFKTFSTEEALFSVAAEKAWQNLLSGREGVSYEAQEEGGSLFLSLSPRNLLKILCSLLFPDRKELFSWKELGAQVREARSFFWGEERGFFSLKVSGAAKRNEGGSLKLEAYPYLGFKMSFARGNPRLERNEKKAAPFEGGVPSSWNELNLGVLFEGREEDFKKLRSSSFRDADFYKTLRGESFFEFLKFLARNPKKGSPFLKLYLAFRELRFEGRRDLVSSLFAGLNPSLRSIILRELLAYYERCQVESKVRPLAEEFLATLEEADTNLAKNFLRLPSLSPRELTKKETGPLLLEGKDVSSMLFTKDGRKLVVADTLNQVRIWNLEGEPSFSLINGGVCFHPTLKRNLSPLPVVLSEDESILLTACSFEDVKAFEFEGGRLLKTFPKKLDENGFLPFYFSRDGKKIFWGNTLSNPHYKKEKTIKGSFHHKAVSFSPDSRFFAVGFLEGVVKLWNLTTSFSSPKILREKTFHITKLSFSEDSKKLFMVAYEKTLRKRQGKVWDLAAGKILYTLDPVGKEIGEGVFSLDGKHIITVHGLSDISVWSALTGNKFFTLEGVTRHPSGFSLSSDGKSLVTLDEKGKLYRIDIGTGVTLSALSTHFKNPLAVAVSSDGKKVAINFKGFGVKVWNFP